MASDLKPAYLITGSDRPKIALALSRLRSHFDPQAVERLSAEVTRGEDAVAACNALGLFGGEGRLVVVDEVERWRADDVKAVGTYLAAPSPGTVLALIAGELRKDSPLTKTIAKAGEVLVFDVDRKKTVEWVAQQFAARGVDVDRDLCRALVEAIVPDGQDADLHHLGNEIEKLATWSGGERLVWEEVERLVVPFGEIPSFALTDALGARDPVAVLRAVEATFEREAASSREVAARLGWAVARHIARLQEVKRLVGEGLATQEIASRLKRHRFYIQKLVRQAESFSEEELRDAVVRLAELDLALKGGSRLPGELELERTLVELARGREPAPA